MIDIDDYSLDELTKLLKNTSDQSTKKSMADLIKLKRMKLNAIKCAKKILADFRKDFHKL